MELELEWDTVKRGGVKVELELEWDTVKRGGVKVELELDVVGVAQHC